ncbi:hypothetical protein [Nocardia wallacei]|uniref:Uncharacterized protein n=1 Tax=Nocardia wallacei TaxID=480035 RepID=A0A7G1KVM1_9NOCA|nr:hypothetical protein [Nocardia wallacei]BCK58991.1 hypothetical protein NWFMUON74_67630 [Nocardia wallacei]
MNNPGIDFGQAEIEAFNNAAATGSVHYDENAVRQAAQLYQNAIDTLVETRTKLSSIQDNSGFGGFRTGQELQQGFSNKARNGVAVINQLIDGAMRLQEAYLRAGGLIDEADRVNSDRLKIASKSAGMGSGLA